MNSKIERKLILFLFIYFLLVFSTHSFTTMGPDEGTHSLISGFYHDLIIYFFENGTTGLIDFSIDYLVTYPKLSVYYPPFFHILTGIAFFISKSEVIPRLLVTLFSVGSIFLTYKIGKELFDEKIGILSSILLSLSPIIFKLSREILIDIPAFFFFLSSIYFGLLAIKKKKIINFLIFGFFVALGFLTRWVTILSFLIIFLIVIFSNSRFKVKFKISKKFLIAFLFFVVILIPYFLVVLKFNLIGLRWIGNMVVGIGEGEPQFTSIEGWFYYLKVLVEQLTLPIALLSSISLFYFILKREKNYKILLIWFLIVYIFFTITVNKSSRYTIYYLPVFLYSLSFILRKTPKKITFFLILIIVIFELYYSFIILPRFVHPISGVVNYLYYNSSGNVAIISEGPEIYSSVFMFHASKLDKQRKMQFFRPCLFFNKSNSEIENILIENNVEKLVYVNNSFVPVDLGKFENASLEKKFGEISIFNFDNYEKSETQKCNFICLTQEKICKGEYDFL